MQRTYTNALFINSVRENSVLSKGMYDMLSSGKKTMLTSVQVDNLIEKCGFSKNITDILLLIFGIATIMFIGTKFSFVPALIIGTPLIVMSFMFNPIKSRICLELQQNIASGQYEAYDYFVDKKFINIKESDESSTVYYYISTCSLNVRISKELYHSINEGEFVTGVIVELGKLKFFVLCNPKWK